MGILKDISITVDNPTLEYMTPPPVSPGAGSFVMGEIDYDNNEVMFVRSTSEIYIYNHDQDSWIQMPNPGIAGTFGTGSCGIWHPEGPSDFAIGGSTTTINTNLTINRSLKGYRVYIMHGPGATEERTIKSNTYGANSIITVETAFSTPITSGSLYLFYTGRYWLFNAGSGSVGFAYYDTALNTWTQRSVAGLPTTWGTDGRLVHTGHRKTFASGSVTSSGNNFLTNSSKNWTTDQWNGYLVAITSGTGILQERTIIGNTADSIIVSPIWATNPDATSTYIVRDNSINMYLLGNNSVTMYKYNIPSNTWSTITPNVARGAVANNGMSAEWVYNVEDEEWTNENKILNGRYIYSFRGVNAYLDRYDLTTNSWSNVIYGQAGVAMPWAGSSCIYNGYILINPNTSVGPRVFSLPENRLVGTLSPIRESFMGYTGTRMWIKRYIKDSDSLSYLYTIGSVGGRFYRILLSDNFGG